MSWHRTGTRKASTGLARRCVFARGQICMADGDTPDAPLFAFYRSKQRKEPMTDARHVRDAAARFDQVIDVSDADRTLAFANIQKAARYTSS